MKKQEIVVAGLLSLVVAASVGFAVAYAFGARTQLEGFCLFVAFASLAAALVVWEHQLMPRTESIEQNPPKRSRVETVRDAQDTFSQGMADVVGRRPWLLRYLYGAIGALGISALFPLRSLTKNLGSDLQHTAWRDGVRLVRVDGTPVRASDIEVDSIVTVFPEGRTGPDDANAMANAATMLVRVPPEELRLPADRATWAPGGLIALSKVCTHAGCPVALYRARSRELFCPCHQSTFDVLRGGVRTFGPAVRSLPQLPIAIAADGTLVARGDFPEPVGPGYWERA